MSTKEIKIIQGKVEIDPYGSWSDVDRGIFIDGSKVDYLISNYAGKTIKITIEEIIEEE